MEKHELLRHIADNIESGRDINHGLLRCGYDSRATDIGGMVSNHKKYTLKPSTVVINGIEVERGVDVEPAKNRDYFIPAIESDHFHKHYFWRGDEFDRKYLTRGIVFLEKKKAIEMATAMLAFNES